MTKSWIAALAIGFLVTSASQAKDGMLLGKADSELAIAGVAEPPILATTAFDPFAVPPAPPAPRPLRRRPAPVARRSNLGRPAVSADRHHCHRPLPRDHRSTLRRSPTDSDGHAPHRFERRRLAGRHGPHDFLQKLVRHPPG